MKILTPNFFTKSVIRDSSGSCSVASAVLGLVELQ